MRAVSASSVNTSTTTASIVSGPKMPWNLRRSSSTVW